MDNNKEKTLFRKKSLDKVSSPEQLDDYIKVTSIGVWAVIAAAILLLIGFGVWAVFGSASTVVNMQGVADKGVVTCYVSDVSDLKPGLEADVYGVTGEITQIESKPVSKNEIAKMYDDYTVYSLNLSEWNYVVKIAAEDCPDGTVSVRVIADEIHPISFIGR